MSSWSTHRWYAFVVGKWRWNRGGNMRLSGPSYSYVRNLNKRKTHSIRNLQQHIDPIKLMNLSKSFAPPQAINAHVITTEQRKAFFCHLMLGLCFPVFSPNRACSTIRMVGNNARGFVKWTASAYPSWTVLPKGPSGRLSNATVWTLLPNAR